MLNPLEAFEISYLDIYNNSISPAAVGGLISEATSVSNGSWQSIPLGDQSKGSIPLRTEIAFSGWLL